MELRIDIWIPSWRCLLVFAFPTGATDKCLDPQPRLHTGVWIPKQRYVQVFRFPTGANNRCVLISNWGHTHVLGSPTGATYMCVYFQPGPHRCLDPQPGATPMCLDPQPGLHTGVCIPERSHTQVFGSPTRATHGSLESDPGLHTCRCSESQTGDPASCHFPAALPMTCAGPAFVSELAWPKLDVSKHKENCLIKFVGVCCNNLPGGS